MLKIIADMDRCFKGVIFRDKLLLLSRLILLEQNLFVSIDLTKVRNVLKPN